MANPEHLAILKQGVEAWNKWRKENPTVWPRLEDANLTFSNLCFANLAEADLRASNLIGANLSGADLSYADLNAAQLANANLAYANLNFTQLGLANLTSANIALTDFRCALLLSTIIGDVDLARAKGIEYAIHALASTIGTDTLRVTAGSLSNSPANQGAVETFLRGAGVEEHMVEYFRSMIGKPIEFYSCFISYSHADKPFSRRLHDQLQARGIRCWLDEKEMKPGDRILDAVLEAIGAHDRILLCCSEASLHSWWVHDEIRKVHERERQEKQDILIPLNLDGYLLTKWEDGLAADIRSRLAADFTGWEHDNSKFEEQFERVVKALRTEREEPPEVKLFDT